MFYVTSFCLLCVGGDMDGHSGIALYHDSHWITVVISTGESYWKASAFAMVLDGYWNNIGVIWDKNGVQVKIFIT